MIKVIVTSKETKEEVMQIDCANVGIPMEEFSAIVFMIKAMFVEGDFDAILRYALDIRLWREDRDDAFHKFFDVESQDLWKKINDAKSVSDLLS